MSLKKLIVAAFILCVPLPAKNEPPVIRMHYDPASEGVTFTLEEDCQHTETTFKCVKVDRVIDGDTVVISIPGAHPTLGQKISLRLRHLDVAELRSKNKCEKEKAQMAKILVEIAVKRGKRFDVTEIGRGKFYRILGTLLIDGKSVADQLIAGKLAYLYEGKKKLNDQIDWCVSTQKLRKK